MSKIFLADCNNFYVSCERVFNPHLRNKPVVVLSSNDACIIARSNEAKRLHIGMGDPWWKHSALYKRYGVLVYSANFPLYGDMSARVMNLLYRLTSQHHIHPILLVMLTQYFRH